MKKIKSVLIIAIIAVAFCGVLTGCSNLGELENKISKMEQEIGGLKNSLIEKNLAVKLAEEKQNAVEEISIYAKQSVADNFQSYSNYEIIVGKLNYYINSINNANAVDVVTNKVAEFKNEINKIVTIEPNFACYTLQEAYDNGFINIDNLKDIAKASTEHLYNSVEARFQTAIKISYLEELERENELSMYPNIDVEHISIHKFLGEYKGSFFLQISNAFVDYPAVMKEYTIAGVKISYSGPEILVFKK